MTSKAWKARGWAADDLPSVLRRRADSLQADEHYNDQYVGVFLRAADELEARQRAATDEENFVVEAVSDNRRLRDFLQRMYGRLRIVSMPREVRDGVLGDIAKILTATKAHGDGRPPILLVQVGRTDTRAQILDKVYNLLDQYFDQVAPPASPLPSPGSPGEPHAAPHGVDGDSRPLDHHDVIPDR